MLKVARRILLLFRPKLQNKIAFALEIVPRDAHAEHLDALLMPMNRSLLDRLPVGASRKREQQVAIIPLIFARRRPEV
jgi:hypothetical protein